MNDEYFRQHAARLRQMSSFADPFTKKRLLDLADRYDGNKPEQRQTLPPSVTATEQP